MSRQEPLIVSYYTLNTPYEEEVAKLRSSCEELGLEACIEGVESKGSWEKNCGLKPSFLLQMMQKHQRPLLWVDADGMFKKRPNFRLFDGCDFSVRVNEFLPLTHPSRVVSNTIFLKNTPAVLSLLQTWHALAREALEDTGRVMEFWDQVALRDALEHQSGMAFLPMPLAYSKIFDFDTLFIAESEVVIEHYQASRRHKHKVPACFKSHCCH